MDNIIILGHENPDVDSIVSGYLLEKIMCKLGYNVEFIIPDKNIQNINLDILNKFNFDATKYIKNIDLNNIKQKYILVDHNERDIGGEIIGIIDHHPTNKNINIKHYYNNKVSSTACYIAQNSLDYLNSYDLLLACVATLVDTVSFHSNKSREVDEIWVKDICQKYNFDYDELYKVGLSLTPLDNINEVMFNGIKKHKINDINVESSLIQIINYDNTMINNIINLLSEYIIMNNIDAFVFIVHDMLNFKTMYYLITENKVETKYYDSYTSRGSTIIPEIEKKLIKNL